MTKTNIRKRAISILLILMVMLTMTPMTASAAETWETVTTYEQFAAAMTANEQRNVKLGADIDTAELHYDIGLLDTLTVKGQKQLDLNGHTLRLFTKKDALGNLIKIEFGSLTLSDSSTAKTGRILGVTSTDSNVLISVWQNGKFTMNGGKLEVEAGKFRDALWRRTIDCRYGGEVVINGGTLYVPPKTYERYENQLLDQFLDEFDDLRNGSCGYTLIADNDCKVTITGGTFQGPVRMNASNSKWNKTTSRVIITGGTFENNVVLNGAGSKAGDGKVTLAEIKGGTFLGKVQAWAAASFDSSFSAPEVVISGGDFSKEFWLRPKFPLVNDKEPEGMAYYVAAKLNGGTFHEGFSADKSSKNYKYSGAAVKQRLEAYEIYQLADKLLGQSAIQTGNGTFAAQDNNSYNKYFTNYKKSEHDSGGYAFIIKAVNNQPTKIIPNAWGMKSVALDGDPIDYFKDWYGTVTNIDNGEDHVLKFEWNPLNSALSAAGYSYRANFDCYTVGSNTPTTSGPISATATEYSHTIHAGAAPSVYPYDLQLNLDKNGSSVGIISNQHIVKLVVSEAPPVLDTFISTVSFRLAKTDIGEPGELSFEAKDVNGENVTIAPAVTWDPANIQEGTNNVSFTIPAPEGYTFVGENGKVTTLKFGGVDVIGYVDSTGALNFSFPLEVPHQHKAASVGYNAKYHWKVCSCGQKIMNTSEKHTMSAWEKSKDIPGGGEEYTRSCTRAGCGYTETTIDYSGVKHVTSLVLNMENYPMDGMRPHNFVKNGSETKDSDGEYLLTERDSSILYPSFSITSGNDKAKLYAMNPESYTVRADNPDFAKWSSRGSLLAPGCDDTSHDTHNDTSTFTTGKNYGVRLFLEAENGYAFYKDFNEASNFKLFTDMNGIEVETYRVEAWYYKNTEGVDDWITKAPADDSAGASKVRVLFQLTAKNEGKLDITLPELKAGDDLKAKWAVFDGKPNFGTDEFVKDCYRSKTMAWRSGPSCVIHNNTVTGESVTAQAGQTYTLDIPAVNENVLAHITIKNPTAATKIVEMPNGAISVTYKLPAAAVATIVNGAAVSITPPAYGAAPSTTATVAGTAHYTASAVTWNPVDVAFGEKAYTATVTLTANTGYTFASDAVFTINGHKATVTTNADGSVTLSYTFPKLTAPHAHDYSGQPYLYLDPGNHYQECKVNDGGLNIEVHDFSAWTKVDDTNHSRTCTKCKKSGETANYIETAAHTWVWVVDQEAALNQPGMQHEECTDCHAKRSENTVIPALQDYEVVVTGGKASDATGATITRAMENATITITAQAPIGQHFVKWIVKAGGVTLTNETSATTTFTMPANDVTIEASFEKNASSGGYVPTVQKPDITIIGSGKADLSADGRTATITADAGHELVSVVLNGKEMGKVEKLTGLKTGDKATITFQAKTDGKAEMDKMIAQKASKLKLMARSAKTAKKNIKVVVKGDLKAITDAGYTVKYKFYRSTKKSAGYKAMLTKKAPTYFNTYGKKGTMYYYKARVMIYDKDGNFVAQTALKQCKYANRLWTK